MPAKGKGSNRRKRNPPTTPPFNRKSTKKFNNDDDDHLTFDKHENDEQPSHDNVPSDPLTEGGREDPKSNSYPDLTPSLPGTSLFSAASAVTVDSCNSCPSINTNSRTKSRPSKKKGVVSIKIVKKELSSSSKTRRHRPVKRSRSKRPSSSTSIPAAKKEKSGAEGRQRNKKSYGAKTKKGGVSGSGGRSKSRAGGSTSAGTRGGSRGEKPTPPVIDHRRRNRGAAGGGGAGAGGAGGNGGGGGGDRRTNLDKANGLVVDFQRQIELFLQQFNELLDFIQTNLVNHPETRGHLIRLNVNRFRFGFVQFHARAGLERLHHDAGAAFTATDSIFRSLLQATGALSALMNSWTSSRMFRGYRFLYGNVAGRILRDRIQAAQARGATLAARLGVGGQLPDISPATEFEVIGEGDGLAEERAAAGGQNGQPLNRNAFVVRQGYNQAMGSRFINAMGYLRARLEMQLMNVQNVSSLTNIIGLNMMLLQILNPTYEFPEEREGNNDND